MNYHEYSKIQKSLGVIEGVALGLTGAAGEALLSEVANIDEILTAEMHGGVDNENKT